MSKVKVNVKAKGKVKPSWIKEEGEKVVVQERLEESGDIAKYSNINELSLSDNKVALAVEGLHPFYEKMLRERISKENALVISEYINSLRREINVSIGHRKTSIDTLVALAKFLNKKFKEMTREDILLYLDSLGKPESSDPLHKWIGTYNLRRAIFVRFFKWLYYPDIEPNKRIKPKIESG